ncbi:uncharacterized, partial [Tachysurus ichikawai]
MIVGVKLLDADEQVKSSVGLLERPRSLWVQWSTL